MIAFQQTDAVAGCGVMAACSGTSPLMSTSAREMALGGVPGTASHVVTVGGLSVGSGVMFQSAAGEPWRLDWAAGDWVVRLNVSVGNARITWDAVYVCRVNGACAAVGTAGSATGLGINLKTAGVKSWTVSGAALGGSAGDGVYVVLVFSNGMTSAQSFQFTSDQKIDTPLSSGVVPVRRRMEDC